MMLSKIAFKTCAKLIGYGKTAIKRGEVELFCVFRVSGQCSGMRSKKKYDQEKLKEISL
ncbi:hypothetical protein [Pedobacter suwonensis]